jgi:hypothetical protein
VLAQALSHPTLVRTRDVGLPGEEVAMLASTAAGAGHTVYDQYRRISSCDQSGWRTSPLGANSGKYGLMSMTGVPIDRIKTAILENPA